MIGTATQKKYEHLKQFLRELGSVAVAFSGGLDSSLLLTVAAKEPGVQVLAVTAHSVIYPEYEYQDAVSYAKQLGVEHTIIAYDPFQNPQFVENSAQRCYHCKRYLFDRIQQHAQQQGIAHVIDGTHSSDTDDFRPGMRAVAELGIFNPLLQAGLTKREVCELAHELGVADRKTPSQACYATRIPYGDLVTRDKIKMIAEAEEFLRSLGFEQVRVRHYGKLARIEVPAPRISELSASPLRAQVAGKLRNIGYVHVAVDLTGYRTGSMNSELDIS